MAQNEQIKGLETQCNHIRERLSRIEGQLSIPERDRSAHPLFIALITLAGTALIGYLGWLGYEIHQQGKDIVNLRTLLSPQIIQDASLHPSDPRSADQVKAAIASAKQNGVKIGPALVSDAGKQFIGVSANNPTAWQAALDLASYRSSYNMPLPLPMGEFSSENSYTQYQVNSFQDKPFPSVRSASLWVPASAAARYYAIGHPYNGGNPEGPPQLLLNRGAVDLDNMDIAHVTFINVEIHYAGQPLLLRDVAFVNCTFVIDNTLSGRALGETLLAESIVNYQSAG